MKTSDKNKISFPTYRIDFKKCHEHCVAIDRIVIDRKDPDMKPGQSKRLHLELQLQEYSTRAKYKTTYGRLCFVLNFQTFREIADVDCSEI
uniref:Uncharacterized protein n=1 Tax=Romanomermis culicivorax TaxID=13658 RepID=A0A915HPX1_ROMCU